MIIFAKIYLMKPFYTIILFLSFSVLGAYAQSLKLKSATHSNLNSSVRFTYKFTSPVFEEDSISKDAFFTRISLYKSENTKLNLGTDYELVTGTKLVKYDKGQKVGLLEFSLDQKNISIAPGKYFGRATLYCANNPDSIWNTIQFNVTLSEYVVLDFRIDKLSVKDLNWDFAGDAIPFVGLFTRKSSSGKGYPDLRFYMYIKGENLAYKNLGDDELSAENVQLSLPVKNGESISFSVKDYDTFSKNDEIITVNNAFVVKNGLNAQKSFTNGNVNDFKVSYKVHDKPIFYQPKLRIKLGADTSKFILLALMFPTNNAGFPSDKLLVEFDSDLLAEQFKYMNRNVGFEVVAQSYFTDFNIPIIDILNKKSFKIKVSDKEHGLSYYQNVIDTVLISKGTKFKWMSYDNIRMDYSQTQKIKAKIDLNIPKFLEGEKVKTEIVAYENGNVNNPINNGLRKISDSELEIDLSNYEIIPTNIKVELKSLLNKGNEDWEIGQMEFVIDFKDFVKVDEIKFKISSSAFSKLNEVDVELRIGNKLLYKNVNQPKTSKKEVEISLSEIAGIYLNSEKVELLIRGGDKELVRDNFELKVLKSKVLSKKIKKAKLVIEGKFK